MQNASCKKVFILESLPIVQDYARHEDGQAQRKIPPQLNALIVSSDGRPLPAAESSDTLWVFPGERFGVMLTPQQEFTASIQVGFADMNTLLEKSVQTVPVTISGYFGTDEPPTFGDMLIFPNPSSGLLTIRLPGTGFQSVSVHDVMGRRLRTIPVSTDDSQVHADISDLPSGTYTLEARGSSVMAFSQVAVIRAR